MAIINCKECGKAVSSNAESCPQCGNPINEKEKEGCFLQTLNMGCSIIIVIVGAILLFGLLKSCSS